jgi:hypothetical protein
MIAGEHNPLLVQGLGQQNIVVRSLLASLLGCHDIHSPRPQAFHNGKRNVDIGVTG